MLSERVWRQNVAAQTVGFYSKLCVEFLCRESVFLSDKTKTKQTELLLREKEGGICCCKLLTPSSSKEVGIGVKESQFFPEKKKKDTKCVVAAGDVTEK